MFSADFFSDVLPAQSNVQALGSFRAIVYLRSGGRFTIEEICEVAPGYVVLSVYPVEGVKGHPREIRCPYPRAEPRWDRLAIPYDDILRVEMTVTEPDHTDDEDRGSFGFHAANPPAVAQAN